MYIYIYLTRLLVSANKLCTLFRSTKCRYGLKINKTFFSGWMYAKTITQESNFVAGNKCIELIRCIHLIRSPNPMFFSRLFSIRIIIKKNCINIQLVQISILHFYEKKIIALRSDKRFSVFYTECAY